MYDSCHAIHLHGHSFQVVYIGYPEYDESGFIAAHTRDIQCADESCSKEGCETQKCTMPRWANRPTFELTNKTVRKDTVIVPAGGYVVINFMSDNPGYWFLHCHIEVHQLEGMALIINEAQNQQNPPPNGMNQCGNFIWTVNDFKEKIAFDPDSGAETTFSFVVIFLTLIVTFTMN